MEHVSVVYLYVCLNDSGKLWLCIHDDRVWPWHWNKCVI